MSVIVEKTYTVIDGERGDVVLSVRDDAFYIHRSGECDLYVTSECIDDMIEALKLVRDDMSGVKGCPENGSHESGWIEWSGGDCPVGSDEVIEYVMRSGMESGRERNATVLDWGHHGENWDIVKYRVVS
ncbi:MAG: hypothetical protein CML17_02390 [Pusillimonas sp.]|nr:hypothetical protein [Pusillimonas sp.]|tara:strand:+ start:7 stop:393 length:387 start_codon:yes stop_codon:yes gene_type:complete